ncbi:MAG: Glucose/arabinose dehydrogenase, beta-propeller fold [Candidatus Nitrotoga sp. SPKER]|nr:MAG: Glucose/arabinose dehydrogenase, beta-propeller fold [Candidatus Nitrotoga sp. SPKER]
MLMHDTLAFAIMQKIPLRLMSLCFILFGLQINISWADSLQLDKLSLPPGFQIELLTDAVPDARQMALGRYADGRGVLYVGSMAAGKVYAVELNQDRVAAVHVIASGLTKPVGVAYREGQLYVSAVSRILRLDGIDGRLSNPPKPIVVTDRFPIETHHGWKFIAFGPDGWLYVPVGAPCNICNPDERFANIQRMKSDGSEMEIVARGVRNSVGFDWSPIDNSLWFTDNGRDMLGDDLPSDELNHVLKSGQHFGYPYCHQGDTPDPEFGAQRKCEEFVAPVVKLEAHVASLGMRFYTGKQFPEAYRNNVFIAEHGSWNRSQKVGYQIVRVMFDKQGRLARHKPFISGWLQKDASGKESVWGRPVDVLVMPDGSLLISDDLAGAIYRVKYTF